jgi:hypothetical protein
MTSDGGEIRRCGNVRSCIPAGEVCGCVDDGMGGQVCTSDAELCDACTGPSLGESCDPDGGEPCCEEPAVTCQGVEFPTCTLAL